VIDITPPPDRTPPGARKPPWRVGDPPGPLTGPERAALWVRFGLAVALELAFLVAGWTLFKSMPRLPIEPWQKVAFQVGLGLAFVVFGARALKAWRRLHPEKSTADGE